MSKKLFIGNLDWNATQDDLTELFSPYGEIEEAVVIKDPAGRSKGFGFVTFVNDEDADKAVAELNGHQLLKREIVVNEARPREDRPRGPRGPRREEGNF